MLAAPQLALIANNKALSVDWITRHLAIRQALKSL